MRGGLFYICLLLTLTISSQDALSQANVDIDERLIVETKWRYTYALHKESNTIIHKAADLYKFFLYFRYDYTYDQYLNSNLSKGTWSLHKNELFYSFKNIQKFEIAEINKRVLILEFNQPNSKGTYQYHFVKVDTEDAPFVKPPNELPDINVEAIDPRKSQKSAKWLSYKNRKSRKRRAKKIKEKAEALTPYISIELIGGGYYGGIDPVLRDYILIKNDGRLIKEYKSVNTGLITTKIDIPRPELEEFAEFILSQKFFDLERIYDCETEACQRRKRMQPTPIPLRLAVAYGNRRKVITIPVWGKDEHEPKYIDYPKEIDHIVDAIQRMAHRIEKGWSLRK